MYGGEMMTEDYKEVNPAKQVPTLTEGDFKLAESHAILRYLHQINECPDHWYPANAKKRALVDQYLDWHHSHLRAAGFGLLKKMYGFITIQPLSSIS